MRPQLSKEIQWLVEEKYRGRFTPSAKRDIARLQKGEHVDYVIGFVDFLGCNIDVSKKPFIPRSETEYWVEQAIHDVQKSYNCKKSVQLACLDLFAGSGCIGISILKHILWVLVDFAEKNKRLLSQIYLNAKKNGITKERYRVVRSDMFSGIKRKYDYIFANPPYIAESRKRRVQPSVLQNESPGALFARKDGLGYIRRFLKEAKSYLNPGGRIYMEFDSPQKKEIEKMLERYEYQQWAFQKDQYGKWRFVTLA